MKINSWYYSHQIIVLYIIPRQPSFIETKKKYWGLLEGWRTVHLQKSPPNLGWIGCVSQIINPKNLNISKVSNFIIAFVGNFSPYPLYMLGTTVKCCTFFIFYPLILYPLTNPRSVLFTGSEAANASRNFNELNRAIQREVTRLSERWSNLISKL